MEKFQKWHEEHEAALLRRAEENKKQLQARKQAPVIKKVEEAPETPAAPAADGAEG
jgi:small subunit ribosomal protein S16